MLYGYSYFYPTLLLKRFKLIKFESRPWVKIFRNSWSWIFHRGIIFENILFNIPWRFVRDFINKLIIKLSICWGMYWWLNFSSCSWTWPSQSVGGNLVSLLLCVELSSLNRSIRHIWFDLCKVSIDTMKNHKSYPLRGYLQWCLTIAFAKSHKRNLKKCKKYAKRIWDLIYIPFIPYRDKYAFSNVLVFMFTNQPQNYENLNYYNYE